VTSILPEYSPLLLLHFLFNKTVAQDLIYSCVYNMSLAYRSIITYKKETCIKILKFARLHFSVKLLVFLKMNFK